MNFIFENFPQKEPLQLEALNIKLPELNTQLENCRREVSLYLDNVQERIEEQPKRNENHISAVKEIKQDLIAAENKFNTILSEDLIVAENSYENLVGEFNDVTTSISVVHILCEIHQRLSALQSHCYDYKDFEKAVDIAEVLKVLIQTLSSNHSVPFIEEFKKMVNNEIKKFNSLLEIEFQKYCIIKKTDNYSFMKVPKNLELLQCIFRALYKNTNTNDVFKLLPGIIWKKLFVSVIKYNCSVVHEEDDEFEVLRIEINDVKDNVKYDMVYQNIIVIIDFLMKYVNCYLDGDLGVVNIIGMEIKKPLAESVFEECILKSVPKDWRVVGKFKEDLLVSTKELKKKLIPCGLYDKKWECVYDIEKFYTQNRCHYFNEKAKEIMKRDLHSMIEVGTPYNPRNSLVESDEFLCCSISSNIPELIKLGENLISEMCDGPTENVNDLFKTYKGIFFNYGDFVAAYHQKLLETIPQQVALFYNNCKYLYRQLSEWDQMFETHDKLNEFCDDSSKAFYEVEEVGRVFFNSFVDEQKNQIEAILKQTNLQNKKTLDKLEDNTEKLLRQCLRQQELLKTVWSKVLSYPVYNETIGDIFSSMCTFLINALVKIEDIEAVVAENLIEIFKVVLNRGPKLFSDPNETSIYVPQWHKFNEVIFILGASLVDINDQWADGKGPLALHFKSYELKQLIRALFQNTDRRAAVLAKIHE